MKRFFTYIFVLLGLFAIHFSAVGARINTGGPLNLMPGKATVKPQGNPYIPFIVVKFPDMPFSVKSPIEYYDAILNSRNLVLPNFTGSVRDWFTTNSVGSFIPDFEVIGPITADHPYSYYGANNAYGEDVNATELVKEVFIKASELTDMSKFDMDGDSYVDFTFVCYAGQGEATSGIPNAIWPTNGSIVNEASLLSETIAETPRVKIDRYALTNEWEGNRASGIGTIIHQYLLACGLPTLTEPFSRTGASSPLSWDIMDTGYLNNNGLTPPNLSSVERMTLGWLTPYELTTPDEISLSDLAETNEAVRINANSDKSEYFLLEYRAAKGWDAYLPNHGLLIWHVDYDEEIWKSGTVNADGSHHHVRLIKPNDIEIVPVNGTAYESILPGWCFPGKEGVTEITNETTPSLRSWEGEATSYPLTSIEEDLEEGMVTFFIGDEKLSNIPVGIVPTAEEIGERWFKASWRPVEGAEEYIVSVYRGIPRTSGTSKCDFGEDGIFLVPYGWDIYTILNYTAPAYCGDSSPSLRFRDEGAYLVTPTMPHPIRSFTFWAKNISGEKPLLIVSGRDSRNSSFLLSEITVSDHGEVYEFSDILEGKDIRQLKFLFQRMSGSMALDDIVITYGKEPEPLPGYEALSVTGETSVKIDNLPEDETLFYYTVRSVKNGEASEESAPIEIDMVHTTVDEVACCPSYTLNGDVLETDASSTLYSISGACLGTGTRHHLPGAGIYILHQEGCNAHGGFVEKIVVGVK